MELSQRELSDKMKVCRHFNGVGLLRAGVMCKAGVEYCKLAKVEELGREGCALRTPCTGKPAGSVDHGEIVQYCASYEPKTEEQVRQEFEYLRRGMEALEKGLSPCCNAPVDDSQTIQSGRYKGHGVYYCSQCKKLLFCV